IRRAGGVLIATPEYNGSIPGVLKNALGWASRPYQTNPLRGKPVAVIGGSPGPRGARAAQDELRRVLGIIGAEVVGEVLAASSLHQRVDEQGRIRDEPLRRQVRAAVAGLTTRVSGLSLPLAG